MDVPLSIAIDRHPLPLTKHSFVISDTTSPLLLNMLTTYVTTIDHPNPTVDDAPAFSPKEDISSLFPDIHGGADWCRLLNPLHPWLRREIIKYGELAKATYDGLDFNPFFEFCGSCLYGRHWLLEKLGLSRNGYEVSRYVYAMSHVDLPAWLQRSIHADAWSTESNWMGFVAVSDDEESRRIGYRDVVDLSLDLVE
ncbi:hypothetical protein OPV22_024487 [Ensete ventricosum]|uniref:Uncharacterized protein n=1 Tax=Ensete ventricosum TaxID=4639 RepID=A0AAV8Q161_ENSVE|nr:hypothetical protein OPV22_024487 [Ensete ventricosum]